VSNRFDFLELGTTPQSPVMVEEADPAPQSGWKPLRLRCVEVIGEPGDKAGQFAAPTGIATDAWGGLYVADSQNHRVQRITPAGEVYLYGRTGNGAGQLWNPQAVTPDPSGQFFFVADHGNNRVQCFRAMNGQPVGSLSDYEKPFRNPSGVAFDAEGMLWIADMGNGRLLRYNTVTSQFIGVLDRKVGIGCPVSVACDKWNTLFVTDRASSDVVRYSVDGKKLGRLGENRRLSQPSEVVLDAEGRIYLVETGANRLHVFSPEGESLLVYDMPNGRLGAFKSPTGVALGVNGEIYVSDTLNHRVLHLTWD